MDEAGDGRAPTPDEILVRLGEMERRLAVQQRILDERLLRLETNRVFELWKRLAALLKRRFPGRNRDERADADRYVTWLAHEQAAVPDPAQARAAVEGWPCRPSVEIVSCARTNSQIYPHVRPEGDYLCFVDDAYELSPWAAYFIAESARRNRSDIIYADEDHIDGGRRHLPVLKPGWSPVLLQSCMYFGGMFAVRRDLLSGSDLSVGSADLPALALRVAARARRVDRLPRILSHRRRGVLAVETRAPGPPAPTPGAVTVIICSRNAALLRPCLDSLRATAAIGAVLVVAHEENGGPNEPLRAAARDSGATVIPYTGPFNFSVMNNLAAAAANTPYLLFLNDDVTARAPGWLESLLGQVSRDGIGIAGALMRYPSGEIQHAGIVLGIGDGVGHAGRGARDSRIWPWLLATRNVSAVTGACLAIRTDLFRSIGGFDRAFPNNYNDVDLCFRARERGYEVVCVPVAGLTHAECQTRRGLVRFDERYRLYQRWGSLLDQPDPFYSPALASTERIALDLAFVPHP